MDEQQVSGGTQSKRLHPAKIALIVVVLAVIGGYLYWYSFSEQPSAMNVYQEKYNQLHTLHHQGDLTNSIESGKTLLTEAPTASAQVHLKSLIAFDLWNRNQGNDRAQAVQMYKELINDSAIAPADKAGVLNDLAFLIGYRDRDFYVTNFNEPPFNSLLPATPTPGEMTQVSLKLFSLSDTTYPNSLANYSIAYLYSGFIGNNSIPESMTREEVAALVQDRIAKADAYKNTLQYEPSHVARQRLYRAIGLNASSRVLKNVAIQEREEAFVDALPKAGDDEESYQTRGVFMQARFFYANFLLENFGQEREDDIRLVLQKFGGAKDSTIQNVIIQGFFRDRSESDFVKVQATKLAAISSEFKSFLESLGWTL